jgi:hypothetical protein
LRVRERLSRLRHDTVVCRDCEDDDVGRGGAARAHRAEGRMAGRVQEGNC